MGDAAPDHYSLLGIGRDAEQDDVVAAYRRLAKRVHPDTGSGSAGLFALITHARDVLLDPGRRAVYDQELRTGPPRTSSRTTVPEDPVPADGEPDVGADTDYVSEDWHGYDDRQSYRRDHPFPPPQPRPPHHQRSERPNFGHTRTGPPVNWSYPYTVPTRWDRRTMSQQQAAATRAETSDRIFAHRLGDRPWTAAWRFVCRMARRVPLPSHFSEWLGFLLIWVVGLVVVTVWSFALPAEIGRSVGSIVVDLLFYLPTLVLTIRAIARVQITVTLLRNKGTRS